jgi:hypothetical protein
MPKTTCHEAFNNGAQHRAQFPLPHGAYTLIDTRDRLKSCKAEIDRIRNYVSGRADKWSLEHCTYYDKHKWLKDLPERVSFSLGRDLLPGLSACEGAIDGADLITIQNIYPTLKSNSHMLIGSFETIHQQINKSIEAEYSAMRAGGSLLEPLVDDAIGLFDKALTVMP